MREVPGIVSVRIFVDVWNAVMFKQKDEEIIS
jgi:hypothetical protein